MTEFNDNQYWQYPAMFPFHPGPVPLGAVSDGKMVDAGYDAIVISSVGEGPKGEKGDTIPFDSLTDEQLERIYEHASFATAHKRDIFYSLTEPTSSITLPSSSGNDDDWLFNIYFVDINGISCAEGVDWVITDGELEFDFTIPAGNMVTIHELYYDLVDGEKKVTEMSGGHSYRIAADMIADAGDISLGDACHLLGRGIVGDDGAGWYVVAGSQTGASDIQIASGKWARFVSSDNTEDLVDKNSQWDRVMMFQNKAFSQMRSLWLLLPYKDSAGNTVIDPDFNSSRDDTNYLPNAYFAYGSSTFLVQGEFKTKQAITPLTDSTQAGKNKIAYPPILVCEYRPDVIIRMYHCLTCEIDGVLKTMGLAMDTDGYMYIINESSATIPAGTIFRIDINASTNPNNWGGDFNVPQVTTSAVTSALNWIHAHRGQFYYDNGRISRLNPLSSGKTDCSGMVYSAFKYSSDLRLPTGATGQNAIGIPIAFAQMGEELDFTNAQPGDLVGYYHPGETTAHHVAIWDGTMLWHEAQSYGATPDGVAVPTRQIVKNGKTVTVQLGPQPVTNPRTHNINKDRRIITRLIGAADF